MLITILIPLFYFMLLKHLLIIIFFSWDGVINFHQKTEGIHESTAFLLPLQV